MKLTSCLLLLSFISSVIGARWNEMNCSNGTVTDFVCCHDTHCAEEYDEASCNSHMTCLWNEDKKKCLFNRDDRSNVCCMSKVSDICDGFTKGKCPLSYQVPSGCCSKAGLKYEGILTVNKTGFVCCNTPCNDMEYNGCEVPPVCYQKSYGAHADTSLIGFRPNLINRHQPIGQVYDNINFYGGIGGYGGHYGGGYNHYGFNDYFAGSFPGKGIHDEDTSQHLHTKEITADDVLSSLIEALSRDDDVFTTNQEITSDPILGKKKYGGLVDNFHYIDPDIFLDHIYSLPLTYGGGGHRNGFYGYGNHFGGYGGHHRGGYGHNRGYGYGHHVGGYGRHGGGYGGGFGGGYGHSGYGNRHHKGSGYGHRAYDSDKENSHPEKDENMKEQEEEH